MFKTDKTYLINLPHRSDRLRIAKQNFLKAGIENYTIFPAIDARKLRIKGVVEENQGLIGCFLSHYFILQEAIINNYKRIAIFEDDIILVSEFQENFKLAMSQ